MNQVPRSEHEVGSASARVPLFFLVASVLAAAALEAGENSTVSVVLGPEDETVGLRNVQRADGTDGENAPLLCGPADDSRSARQNLAAGDDDFPDAYAYFLVTDPGVKNSRRIDIRATFFDDPAFAADPVTIRLDYTSAAATGPGDIPHTFTRHPRAWTLSGSGRWVRHAWSITDAGFRTFMQGTSDFRFDFGLRSVCIHRVDVTAVAEPSPPAGVLVGVHYYPWYDVGRWSYRDCGTGALRLELRPPQIPALGRYDSSRPDVVDRHLRWCAESGIDVVIFEFYRPGSRADRICREVILPHPRSADVHFTVLYDWAIRFGGDTAIDAEKLATAASDFRHLAREYFPHPSYLRYRDRPVALIYISRALRGDLDALAGTLRDACAQEGADVFLIGDEFFFISMPRPDRIARWDGIFGYDCYAGREGYWGLNGTLALFQSRTSEYRRTAQDAGVKFFPSILPGFNDRAVRRLCADNPALPRRLTPDASPTSLFTALLDTALDNLDADFPLISVTSFNEWHEDTQIEPTLGRAGSTAADSSSSGTQFTQGYVYDDYGTAFLDAVRDAVVAVSGVVRGPGGPVPGARVEVLQGGETILERRSFSTGFYTIPRLRLRQGIAYRLRAGAEGLGEVLSSPFVAGATTVTGFDLVLGSAGNRFRRGDANGDGTVDISDAVFTLAALFLGEAQPRCPDSADANDDGALDISDAVTTLNSLFLGTVEIPPPGPNACGEDPSEDDLTCKVYASCDA